MIEIGKYNTLTILRDTKVGLFLGKPLKSVNGIFESRINSIVFQFTHHLFL